MSARARDGWVAAQFALSGLVWGASFLFIAIALTGMTFVQVAAGRALLGAVTLGLIVLVTRDRLPAWGPIYGHLAVVGVTFWWQSAQVRPTRISWSSSGPGVA